MSKDYLSFHAVRPWDSEERSEDYPAHYRGGGDTMEQIRCCLVCKRPVCVNCMHRLKKGEVPAKERPASPCMTCPTQRMCQDRGWTCADKRQWEETYG